MTDRIEFEVLAGLPSYGPEATPFAPPGRSTHAEGLVVRVIPRVGAPWVGNFQRQMPTGHDAIHVHPDWSHLLVIAGGIAYLVEPESRTLVEILGSHLCWSLDFPEHQLFVFHNGIAFRAFGAAGRCWDSRRVSWDGIRVETVSFPTLTGTAWTFDDDRWIPFVLQLETGEVSGGSYPRE
jgi:hypothetical protein